MPKQTACSTPSCASWRRVAASALLAQPALNLPSQKDKPSAGLADDDALYLEGFALKIFGRADTLDRSGRADLATARALYASFLFFEVLHVFQKELAPELAAKQRYAAWRAAEINAAVKEGRAPAPPPSEAEQGAPEDALPEPPQPETPQPAAPPTQPAAAWNVPRPPPGLPPAAQTPAPRVTPPTAPSAHAAQPGRPYSPSVPSPPPGLRPPVLTDLPSGPSASGLSAARLAEAPAAARTAASALAFDDVPTAVTQLRLALDALGSR